MRIPKRSGHRLAASTAVLALAVLLTACSSTTAQIVQSASPGQAIGQPSPFLGANLTAVGCGTSGLCVAVGVPFEPNPSASVVTTSKDAGLNWTASATPAPPETALNDASCSVTNCMIVGSNAGKTAAFARTSSGNWSTITVPIANSTPQAVGCTQKKWCLMILNTSTGIVGVTTTNAGKHWSAPSSLPAGVGQMLNVTCASTNECIATGISANGQPQVILTTNGFADWQIATLPPNLSVALGGSCTSSMTCYVVAHNAATGSNQLLMSQNGNTTFSVSPPLSSVQNPTAVSCFSNLCVFVGSSKTGQGAVASQLNSSPFHSIKTKYVPTSFLGVSCLSMTACEGVTTSSLVQIVPPTTPPTTTTS